MKSDRYSHSHSFASGLAAAAVTTVLVSSLVGSFEPEQLLRFNDETAPAQVAADDARRNAALAGGA